MRSAEPVDISDDEEAAEVLQEILDTVGASLATPEDAVADTPQWEALVDGSYQASLYDQAQEFEAMGWRQIGAVKVLDVEVLDADIDEARAEVRAKACLDSSEVQVIDEFGISLRNEGSPDRVPMIFTLVERDGTWVIVSEEFADGPSC